MLHILTCFISDLLSQCMYDTACSYKNFSLYYEFQSGRLKIDYLISVVTELNNSNYFDKMEEEFQIGRNTHDKISK